MNKNNRISRERDFHNDTFSTNTRKSAKKYYKSAQEGFNYYLARIRMNSGGRVVLEYGCGPGSSAFQLSIDGANVHAIDISDVAIHQAQQKALEKKLSIIFSVMDAENLKFENEKFDLICGSGILHHLDLVKAYSEINRTLKSGGRAVFFEPLGHNPFINLYRKMTPKMRTSDEHPLMMKDIALAKEYFDEVEIRYFTFLAIGGAFVPSLMRYLEKIDGIIFRWLPFLRRYAWIVVLEVSSPKVL